MQLLKKKISNNYLDDLIKTTEDKIETLSYSEYYSNSDTLDEVEVLVGQIANFGKTEEVSNIEKYNVISSGLSFEKIDISSASNSKIYIPQGNGQIHSAVSGVLRNDYISGMEYDNIYGFGMNDIKNITNADGEFVDNLGIPYQLGTSENDEVITVRGGVDSDAYSTVTVNIKEDNYANIHYLACLYPQRMGGFYEKDEFSVAVNYSDGSSDIFDASKDIEAMIGDNSVKTVFSLNAFESWATPCKKDYVAKDSIAYSKGGANIPVKRYTLKTNPSKKIISITFSDTEPLGQYYAPKILSITAERMSDMFMKGYIEENLLENEDLKYDKKALAHISDMKEHLDSRNIELSQNMINEDNGYREIYVSNSAFEIENGSIDYPFSTLEKALDYVKKHGASHSKIVLREGNYTFNDKIIIDSALNAQSDFPLVITAFENENVVFYGNKEVDMTKASVVTDSEILNRIPSAAQGNVYAVNLSEQGFSDMSAVYENYMSQKSKTSTALIWNDKVYDKAAWPNNGQYAYIESVVNGGSGHYGSAPSANDTGATFKPAQISENFEKWGSAKNALVSGFMYIDWSWDSVFLKSVDTSAKTISTKTTPSHALSLSYPNRRFRVENLLEELDVAGEWYIDPETNILYVYPPEEITEDTKVELPYFSKAFFEFDNAQNIVIENITFNGGMSNAVVMSNGTSNCKVKNCVIKNFMSEGIVMNNTQMCGVEGCILENFAKEVIVITADNFKTLRDFGNYVDNCQINNYAMQIKAYASAIEFNSIGTKITHNEIHNGPYVAIFFNGNENEISYNEIYDVCKEVSDSGAIYAGYSFIDQGNTIESNYIHDVVPMYNNMDGYLSGIYMDDMESGVTITKNIIDSVPFGVLIGGGKDVKFTNNIIMNSVSGVTNWAISADDRGTWWAEAAAEQNAQEAYSMYTNNAAWQKEYSHMEENYWDNNKYYPTNCEISNNIIYKHAENDIREDYETYGTVKNNKTYPVYMGSPFVDEANGNLNLKSDSYVYTLISGFENIDFDAIGNY